MFVRLSSLVSRFQWGSLGQPSFHFPTLQVIPFTFIAFHLFEKFLSFFSFSLLQFLLLTLCLSFSLILGNEVQCKKQNLPKFTPWKLLWLKSWNQEWMDRKGKGWNAKNKRENSQNENNKMVCDDKKCMEIEQTLLNCNSLTILKSEKKVKQSEYGRLIIEVN